MEAPNNGSTNASIRSTRTPSSMTASSTAIMPIMAGASTYSSVPVITIKPMPSAAVSQPSR